MPHHGPSRINTNHHHRLVNHRPSGEKLETVYLFAIYPEATRSTIHLRVSDPHLNAEVRMRLKLQRLTLGYIHSI